jgi:hypothetical protein
VIHGAALPRGSTAPMTAASLALRKLGNVAVPDEVIQSNVR